MIAAIQVLGAYPGASRKVEQWTAKPGESLSADSWQTIFTQHPEFFRLNGEWASLRWRHACDRTYDAVRGRELTDDEIAALAEEARAELTRRPLDSDQIEALLKTAVDLHSRTIAHEQEQRRLIPLLFAYSGTILGAVICGILK